MWLSNCHRIKRLTQRRKEAKAQRKKRKNLLPLRLCFFAPLRELFLSKDEELRTEEEEEDQHQPPERIRVEVAAQAHAEQLTNQ